MKENVMTSKYIKRCSILSAFSDMQIKTTKRYYYIYSRTDKILKTKIPDIGKDVD